MVIRTLDIQIYLGLGIWVLENNRMDIILSTQEVDLQECDVLITEFFHDERPLKGLSGWIDWRMNGMLSHLLIENKLTGDWKEKILIFSKERMIPPMVLLVGLGRVKDYSYLRLREFSSYLLETLKNLNMSNVCVSLPSDERYNVNCGKSAEVFIESIADCLDATHFSFDEEWGKRLKLFLSIEEERFPEILLGVQTAQSILKNRLKIRIFAASGKNRE